MDRRGGLGATVLAGAYVAAQLAFASVSPEPAAGATAPAPLAVPAGSTVYLPNITKMLGGPDGWQTPFIVQNIGAVPTDLVISFYAFADGSLARTRRVSGLRPANSIFHDPNSDPELAAGGQYSVVITSSGAPVVAVVNEHQSVTDRTRQEALSYNGISEGATSVSLPYVAKNVDGWLTTFIIQNLGSATATVRASFVSGARTATVTRSVAPGRSQVVDPSAESALDAGVEYSATLTSDQPIGVVVNAHNDAADAPAPMGFSYNGVPRCLRANGIQELPYVARAVDGRTTRVLVQNVDTAPAAPRFVFMRFADKGYQEVNVLPTIAPGATMSSDPRTIDKLSARLGDGEYALRVIGKFAVVAATLDATSAHGTTAFCESVMERNTRSFLPNVARTLGGADGWTTSVAIQVSGALGSPPATVRWYRFSDGALVHTQLVAVSQDAPALLDPRRIAALADDTQYAVMVEHPLGVDASAISRSVGGDGAMAYEGFPAAPLGDVRELTSPRCTPARNASALMQVTCYFSGLQPGATFQTTYSNPKRTSSSFFPHVVDGDGVLVIPVYGEIGTNTVTSVSGATTVTASFVREPATFAVTLTEVSFGRLAAKTKPGATCFAHLDLWNVSVRYVDDVLAQPHTADANGEVAWAYGTSTPHSGTMATHQVACVAGDEWQRVTANASIP